MYIAKLITKENINLMGKVFKSPGTKISDDMIGWYIVGDPFTFMQGMFSLVGLFDAKSFNETFERLEYPLKDDWMKCKTKDTPKPTKNTTCKCKNKGDEAHG